MMSKTINLQQIFYGHNGQKYKILAQSTDLSDDFINKVISAVTSRLKKRSGVEVLWDHFELNNFYVWAQAAPGKKDNSGRDTTLFHIICGEKNPELTGKEFLVYSKFQNIQPEGAFLLDELIISAEELNDSPKVTSAETIRKQKLTLKLVFFVSLISLISILLGAVLFYKEAADTAREKETNRMKEEHQKSLETIAENIGMSPKDEYKRNDIINYVKKIKEQRKK